MRIPRATYRLQFHKGFTFKMARELLGYLTKLGISDIYASPIFAARKGSIHGYDVVDPTSINPEVGTEEEFESLANDARDLGLGWLQDIVPNHMAFDSENMMLMDVFENGTNSEYYDFFDIEWDHAYESMKGRLLAPFLGKSYANALLDGDIRLEYGENGFSVRYYSLNFPLKIESYAKVLAPHFYSTWNLKERLEENHPDYIKFVGILYVIKSFPCQEIAGERQGQIRFIKGILWELYNSSPEIKAHVDENLREINGEGQDKGRGLLDSILYEQFFRLAFWKVASEELNYRRFFSINELISLKMERADVFTRCHQLIIKMIENGWITGLRVDHIDGLCDPLSYLRRLQERTGGVYTIVEKILALDEELPSEWPVQGTSGYDYLNYLNGIFVEKGNRDRFEQIYTEFIQAPMNYDLLLHEKKSIIIERFMTGDVDNLAHLMRRLASRDRGGADITIHGLRRAIYETLAFFPVYRTYIQSEDVSEADRKKVEEAMRRAKHYNPDLLNELQYLEKYLLLQFEDYLGEGEKKDRLAFVMRFQQFTGPLMAKGFEDTTLYVYNRLISLNEVGGEPFAFGISTDKFQEYNRKRADNWAASMSATSTHDTKRGEDTRARINVLSEIPDEWQSRLRTWNKVNQKLKEEIEGSKVPSLNDEYFLYQTLIGAFPFDSREQRSEEFKNRIKEYTIKAIREAKDHTGWIKPDLEYENSYMAFLDRIMDFKRNDAFWEDFVPFQRKIAHYGILNSLSQTLIKITSPGIPDFYQGTELWDLSLVDPDNRRPIDFDVRGKFLAEIIDLDGNRDFLKDLMATPENGKIKLYLIYRSLLTRKENQSLFEEGAYIPLKAGGAHSDKLFAFARKAGNSWVITIAPRLLANLVAEGEYPLGQTIWSDTHLIMPDGTPPNWINAITGEELRAGRKLLIGEVFTSFPLALIHAR